MIQIKLFLQLQKIYISKNKKNSNSHNLVNILHYDKLQLNLAKTNENNKTNLM